MKDRVDFLTIYTEKRAQYISNKKTQQCDTDTQSSHFKKTCLKRLVPGN